jgi:hypothetical protein
MQNDQKRIIELSRNIEHLAALAARSESRLQALEGRRRGAPGLVLGTLLLATFAAGHFTAGPPAARAESPGEWIGHAEQATIETAKAGIRDVVALEQKEQQRFHQVMEGVRQDLNRAKEKSFEPAVAVAVILHDMKRMLEAVPRMADDMHRMTADMHEMNQKMSAVPAMAAEMNMMNRHMGVMTQGVDSTMGRMGRMMPWAP